MFLFKKGDTLEVITQDSALRIIVFIGKPLREAIAWGGPIVMNTSDEIEKAFKEIREGTFGK